jgi:hypothetical protein
MIAMVLSASEFDKGRGPGLIRPPSLFRIDFCRSLTLSSMLRSSNSRGGFGQVGPKDSGRQNPFAVQTLTLIVQRLGNELSAPQLSSYWDMREGLSCVTYWLSTIK